MTPVSLANSAGSGAAGVNVTVSSVAVTPTLTKFAENGLLAATVRSNDVATSWPVIGEPSEKVIPSRNVKVNSVAVSFISQLSAAFGSNSPGPIVSSNGLYNWIEATRVPPSMASGPFG